MSAMASHPGIRSSRRGNPAILRAGPGEAATFSTDLKATLEEPIRVTNHGKAQTVSTQQAALMRLREKALGGDVRALDRLLDLARLYNDDDEMAEAATRLSATDAEILEAHDAKVLRQAGTVQKQSDTRKRRDTRQEQRRSELVLLRKGMTTMASYNELDAILRSDLSLFVRKVFATASSSDAFKPNWHIEAIAHELTRCHTGENRRLLITQPPRTLKSICCLGRVSCLGAGP